MITYKLADANRWLEILVSFWGWPIFRGELFFREEYLLSNVAFWGCQFVKFHGVVKLE